MPTSTPADALSQDTTSFFGQTVAARSSITVPVDFEGSSRGWVVVYARSKGLSVTFAGKALESSPAAIMGATGMAYSADLTNPANGNLVVKNATGAPMEAVGGAMILTRRHLAFQWPVTQPGIGQETSLEVTLTEATAADDLTASTADREGNTTPAMVTKVATGRWTVTAAFSAAGDAYIQASTTGTRLRRASTTVSVVAGDVSFGSGFDEQAVDSDRDGFIDQLVLTPTITIPSAGEYQARAKLLDASGAEVTTNAQGASNLAAGSQPLRLEFDGKDVRRSGRWGPYTLLVTVVRSLPVPFIIDIADARLGQTAAYDYMQFQPDRPLESPPPSGTPWPTSSSVLPKLAAWRGSEILRLASGYQADVVGVQPGGSIVVLEYTNTDSGFRGALFAIRPDGKPKPGWPAAGVPVPVGYGNQVMARDGTVYVSATEAATASDSTTSIDITAVSPDGKVVPGWPYKSPAALHDYRSGQLVVGPSGQVCFMDYLPSPAAQGATGPSGLYCLGADGKTLPGWPYTSYRPMDHPAFGPDGTIYVEQYVEQKPGSQEIVALGPNGKPAPGWTPWVSPDAHGLADRGRARRPRLPGGNGHVGRRAGDPRGRRNPGQQEATGVPARPGLPPDGDGSRRQPVRLHDRCRRSGAIRQDGIARLGLLTGRFRQTGLARGRGRPNLDLPFARRIGLDDLADLGQRPGHRSGDGRLRAQRQAAHRLPDRNAGPRQSACCTAPALVFDSSGNAYAIMYARSGYSVAKIPKR